MRTIAEIEEELRIAERDRRFLKNLLKMYTDQRVSGHQKRLAHVKAMGLPLPEKPRVYDLYYTTSDKLTGEDFCLFNYPGLWIDLKFEEVSHGSKSSVLLR